ncbi:MAG: MFS transporter [Defluviitaleaceae bacterium]|nr:MFS transporter [Defluviitaleaceae bacterium]
MADTNTQFKKRDKWVKGFWPMIFMSFSTGMVYCWTLFREDIEEWGTVLRYAGDGVYEYHSYFTPFILTLCFMLALFCLGMTAAFGGKIVERSVKRASLYTFIFFTLGWLLTGIGIYIRSPFLTVFGFGPVQGIGLGLGYLTPIKTLMMWFDDRKGFAAGVAIAAFGLAGLIGNPLLGILLSIDWLSVYQAFFVLTGLFGVLCFVAYLLIDRPPLKAVDAAARTFSAVEVIFSKKFVFLWVVLFLNIAAGLALMSHEQQIYLMTGLNIEYHRALIVAFCTFTAGGGNLVGRLIMASSQDKTDKKHLPYYVMAIASIAMCVIAFAILPLHFAAMFITIFVVQFFFGCGFACLPGILDQQYGMKQLATIQGYMLTAWAFAALVGPQIASSILTLADPVTGAPADYGTLNTLYMVLAGMFVVQLVFLLLFARETKNNKPQLKAAAQ